MRCVPDAADIIINNLCLCGNRVTHSPCNIWSHVHAEHVVVSGNDYQSCTKVKGSLSGSFTTRRLLNLQMPVVDEDGRGEVVKMMLCHSGAPG